mmetsp:Transcript_49783/g.103860  ORF Transcript_49783/g.103860 Transcript_49783/m.103860 type:complete len:290 (+) Transcript_49783:116-985(+)
MHGGSGATIAQDGQGIDNAAFSDVATPFGWLSPAQPEGADILEGDPGGAEALVVRDRLGQLGLVPRPRVEDEPQPHVPVACRVLHLEDPLELDIDPRLLLRLPQRSGAERLAGVHGAPRQPEALVAELLHEEEPPVGPLADDEGEGVERHGPPALRRHLAPPWRAVVIAQVHGEVGYRLAAQHAPGREVDVVGVEERVVRPELVLRQPLHLARHASQLAPLPPMPGYLDRDLPQRCRALRHHVCAEVEARQPRRSRLRCCRAPYSDESKRRGLSHFANKLHCCMSIRSL